MDRLQEMERRIQEMERRIQEMENHEFAKITARSLEIKDADGRVRIRLSAFKEGPNGDAKVAILDEGGAEIVVVGQYAGIAMVYVQRHGGDMPSTYLASTGEYAGLVAASGGGNAAIELTASEGRGHHLTIADQGNRRPSIDLSVIAKSAGVALKDENGIERFSVNSAAKNASTASQNRPPALSMTRTGLVLQIKQ